MSPSEIKEFARLVWGSLPLQERSIRKVSAECAKLGHPVSRSNIQRWQKEWLASPLPEMTVLPREAIRRRVEIMEEADSLIPERLSTGHPTDDIEGAILEAIDPRLEPLLRFDHIQKLEDALVDVAVEIASRKSEIADAMADPESESETITRAEGMETIKRIKKGQTARDAVVALVQITNGIKTLMATRSTYSVGHRNMGEGDLMSGQGRKAQAKAQAIHELGAPERAKTIDGEAVADDEANAALAALRGQAERK